MYEPNPPFPAQQQTMAGSITANLAANVSVGSFETEAIKALLPCASASPRKRTFDLRIDEFTP